MLHIYDFSIEYVKNAKLIPVKDLRFGWKLESDRRNVLQSAYRIRIRQVDECGGRLQGEGSQRGEVQEEDRQRLGNQQATSSTSNSVHPFFADTGKINSSQYFDLKIPGLVLKSGTDYEIEVTVWDNQGEEAALVHQTSTEILPEEWGRAQWIKPARHIAGWAPYLRTKFVVGEEGEQKELAAKEKLSDCCDTNSRTSGNRIRKAILYASGLGIAEYYINGKRTDDFWLDPPISNYEKSVYYRRFDVTDLIREGGNALAVLLGEGFYSQSIVWEKGEKLGPDAHHGMPYGDVCVKIRLVLHLDDGSVQEIVTDTENWKSRYSPITSNNIYAGEIYDARLETPDFAEYESEEWGWEPVDLDETEKGELIPCLMPPVRAIRELPAVAVQGSSGAGDGTWVFDIGENIAGIAEYHLPRAPRGTVITFRYTETLNSAGSPDHRSTGGYATQCVQQDIYICRGDEDGEVYRPRLGYHGFRYVEIAGIHDVSDGYCTVPQLSVVKGIQLSTDMEKTGDFFTSYEPLDRLDKLMHNTYRSNFHGIPEDCPAREKCGWLGDAQIVVNWGLYNYDSVSAYEKYLEDIRTSVEVYGSWRMISPGKRTCGEATPLWGCAQIVIPYYLYKYCGDREAVLKNADLMRAWIRNEEKQAKEFILTGGLGDWCPPGGEKNPRRIPVAHSSSMEFYEICRMMGELSEELEIGEAKKYWELAEKIRASVNRHFYDYDAHSYGYWGSDGAALAMGIYPDGEKEALLQSLTARIEQDDYEMPTGIFANKYLVPVLMDAGYGDLAFRFLFNKKCRSFQSMLDEDATTIWESFDLHQVEPDRNNGMSSCNHPMHGGFLYSCHHDLAGIRPKKLGFEEFAFHPCFTENAGHVKAGLDAVCGRIDVEIEKREGGWCCHLSVPAGSRAVIEIAGEVLVDGKAYESGTLLGSGCYEIAVNRDGAL